MASSAPAAARRQSERRRPSSRGPKRGMNYGGLELEELVLASELVPTGSGGLSPTCKYSIDFDTASTVPPSSAGQSPDLACMASAADAWPSLREADLNGWDFCSDGSDTEDFWEDLPEPALPIEGVEDSPKQSGTPSSGKTMANWLLLDEAEPATLRSSKIEEIQEGPAQATLAELLRYQQSSFNTVPPAFGGQMPSIRSQPVPRRNGAAAEKRVVAEDVESSGPPAPEWDLRDNASWNKKQQRKVADRKAKKVGQSCKTRGWMQDDEV